MSDFNEFLDTKLSGKDVIADSGFYAAAVEALRGACAQIGEAADAAQRAGFFAGIAGWDDEADATAHDAERVALTAMAEALRAKGLVSSYADAANNTLGEVRAAFAETMTEPALAPVTATEPASTQSPAITPDKQASDSAPTEPEPPSHTSSHSSHGLGDFTDHMADALVALGEDHKKAAIDGDVEASYVKLAQTLSVLKDARRAYREVDAALITLSNARADYLEEFSAASHTALAADLKAALTDDIASASIGSLRSAITSLALGRTAYNAEVSNELWGALAEARINLAAATSTVFEIKTAQELQGKGLHEASALAYSFGEDSTPTGIYDAARDVVIEAKEFRRRAQSACDEVDKLLVEIRAVAADALIEARAGVGNEALADIRLAYDITSTAMDSLFGSRAAFEIGFDFTLPEIFTTP